MNLDKINALIDEIVEMVRPEVNGEVLRKLKTVRDESIQETIFELTKGVSSLIAHIEKSVDKPLKDKKE